MTYWIYEDVVTNRARVHESTCPYCKDGQGTRGSRLSNNRWHGPYTTLDEATSVALKMERRDTKGCGHCLPELPF